MIAAYYTTVSLLASATLIAITLYITHNAAIDHLKTPAISTTMSILATASIIGDEMTIILINLYRVQLSLSFGVNTGFPTLLNNL